MIADKPNICITPTTIKKLIAPSLRPSRALFFFIILRHPARNVSDGSVDSLIRLVDEHPKNDSTKIHWMHTISYMLSESDVSRSFAYYGMVSG